MGTFVAVFVQFYGGGNTRQFGIVDDLPPVNASPGLDLCNTTVSLLSLILVHVVYHTLGYPSTNGSGSLL